MKKISVITGASSGMGAAIASVLGHEYHLLITSSNEKKLENTLADLRGKVLPWTAWYAMWPSGSRYKSWPNKQQNWEKQPMW